MQTRDATIGVVIAVPTLGRGIPIDWAFALAALKPPINTHAWTGIIRATEVGVARNQFCRQALEAGARYLFFLGDDVEPPGAALKQLIYRAEHFPDVGVVGGIYVSKSEPPSPLVFRSNGKGPYWDWSVGELFEVTGIGMDCTLIRCDLLRELEPNWRDNPKAEWFKTINSDGYLDGKRAEEAWTEDLYFCNRVTTETKYKILADSSLMCTHWEQVGRYVWRPWRLRSDSQPFRNAQLKSAWPLKVPPAAYLKRNPEGPHAELARQLATTKKIADLGCGELHWDFGSEGSVTRFDIRDECTPDYRCDLRQLPIADGEFDVCFSSHVLEHFARNEVDEVLDEWLRVLKPGGELRLIVPTVEWAAREILDGKLSNDALNVLYGAQDYGENFHKVGFTEASLVAILQGKGLELIEKPSHSGYNLIVKARKPAAEPETAS